LALVGSSGAGKTTLIQVLMGFLPLQHGQIWLGDTPLSQVALDAWWQQIAWLPQQPQLFTGTVAENIALGQAIDEKRVQQAAAQAQAHEFIQALPQAYATRIGEAGHGLSGGQLQRIGLARAFYKDAPLVILDEATANLDRDSERQIQQALQKLAEGRTVIMIAHRLSTVRHADRIAVLENGALVDVGTHTALLQDCPAYQAMLQAYGDAL